MKVDSIIEIARRLTKTDEVTYPDEDALVDINNAHNKRMIKIMGIASVPNNGIEEAKTDLVSITGLSEGENGYDGEYAFPENMTDFVALMRSIDGKNYYYCTPYESSDKLCDEENIDSINETFSDLNPYVRVERDSFKTRPLRVDETVEDGLKLLYFALPEDMTTNDSPSFLSGLHDILAFDCAEMYAISNPENFTSKWWTNFRIKQRSEESLFKIFYKNRFKRNLRMRSKKERFN